MSSQAETAQVRQQLNSLYQTESRRILATLIRLLGDFDRAEEALSEAFAVALEQWPRDGLPNNPRAWLVSTGRFRAIDALRRRARFEQSLNSLAGELEDACDDVEWDEEVVQDDYLRLIFTCCHPALPADAQIALTLREVCGLTTEEVARAYLAKPSAIAQRIVRAKNKIRDAGIPYETPAAQDLPERLAIVLRVVYLVYNEGYSASAGENMIRTPLTTEALRLCQLLFNLLPHPEIQGLWALMLLQESRRSARTGVKGDLITLEEQDRTLWNQEQIAQGIGLVRQALVQPGFGSYSVQAAIAAVHAESPRFETTDWNEIVGLYDLLLRIEASPIVALNRAVAIAMRDGPGAGLTLVDELLESGALADYHLAHAARADLCRRLGRLGEARQAYQEALQLTQQEPERRFIERRLAEIADHNRCSV